MSLQDVLIDAPRGWHRPVRPGQLLWVALVLLVLWLGLMIGGVMWFYAHFESQLMLREQAMRLRLPSGLPSLASVSSPLALKVPHGIPMNVPVRQEIPVNLHDSVHARVRLVTTLPVSTEVLVAHEVEVKTIARLHAPVHRWLPALDVTVPLQIRLPVRLKVPVHTTVPIDLDMAVSGELDEALRVPVDTVVALRPQVLGHIEAQMQSHTAFRLFGPQEPVPMTIIDTRLRLPFDLARITTQAVP